MSLGLERLAEGKVRKAKIQWSIETRQQLARETVTALRVKGKLPDPTDRNIMEAFRAAMKIVLSTGEQRNIIGFSQVPWLTQLIAPEIQGPLLKQHGVIPFAKDKPHDPLPSGDGHSTAILAAIAGMEQRFTHMEAKIDEQTVCIRETTAEVSRLNNLLLRKRRQVQLAKIKATIAIIGVTTQDHRDSIKEFVKGYDGNIRVRFDDMYKPIKSYHELIVMDWLSLDWLSGNGVNILSNISQASSLADVITTIRTIAAVYSPNGGQD